MSPRPTPALLSHRLVALTITMLLILIAPLAALPPIAHAQDVTIRYAAPSAAGNGSCGSWANACTLQTALTGAAANSEIWVKTGTHLPGEARTDSFRLKNGVAVYGGFAGSETARGQRSPDANPTVLSGQIGAATNNDNAYHVVVADGTDATAVLDGFTIRGGYANGAGQDNSGAGMFINAGSPTLADLDITDNRANNQGGGIDNRNGAPALTDITFNGNVAYSGGGMYTAGGNPVLSGVSFLNNTAYYRGGGLMIENGSPTIYETTFAGNTAADGGGLYNLNGLPTLTLSAFNQNTADNHGGGLYTNGGTLALEQVSVSGNSAGISGGGIDASGGTLALGHVTFTDNTATGSGGGMNVSNSGSTTLNDVTFRGNSTQSSGGGLAAYSSTLALAAATFDDNSSRDYGGGMYIDSGTATLINVDFSRNSTTIYYGGGLYNRYSSLTLTGATFDGNTAGDHGGGMHTTGAATLVNVTFNGNAALLGGGFSNYNGGSTLTNVTLSGNTALSSGGGVCNSAAQITLTHVTLVNNHANGSGGGFYTEFSVGNLAIRNSLLWGNTAPSGAQVHVVAGSAIQLDYDVLQGGCPASADCTHPVSVDPLIGALANHGGATPTITLLPGSPAIDAANPASCAPADQRGVARPQGAACDIGAYEARPFSLEIIGGSGQSAAVGAAFGLPLHVGISSAFGEPVEGGVVSFTAPSSGASATPATAQATISSSEAQLNVTANWVGGAYSLSAAAAGSSPLAFALTNAKLTPTAALTSSGSPSTTGQAVTFSAAVSGGHSPGGTVSFFEGATPIAGCVDVTLIAGQADCVTAALASGAHTLRAEYSGDDANATATATIAHTVLASTVSTVVSLLNPARLGQTVTVRVSVAAAAPNPATPTGMVELSIAPTGSEPALTAALVDGVAEFTLTSLPVGVYTLTAHYSGDATFAAGDAPPLQQTMFPPLLWVYLPLVRK